MKKILKYILINCNLISPKTISRMRKHLVQMILDGWKILDTLFFIKVHKSPLDCTRWIKEGLNFLLQQVGFEKNIIVEQWGNKSAVKANFK